MARPRPWARTTPQTTTTCCSTRSRYSRPRRSVLTAGQPLHRFAMQLLASLTSRKTVRNTRHVRSVPPTLAFPQYLDDLSISTHRYFARIASHTSQFQSKRFQHVSIHSQTPTRFPRARLAGCGGGRGDDDAAAEHEEHGRGQQPAAQPAAVRAHEAQRGPLRAVSLSCAIYW